MLTTVYFATNRAVTGPAGDWRSYGTDIVAPSDPGVIAYATAFVDNTNLTADKTGAITAIQNVQRGGFSSQAITDLSDPGRNLLVFIHGFDNSFDNAITRSAFNREWFAQSGMAEADTTVVAFTWPSLGQLLSFPLPWEDYQHDQTMAGQSGFHLMTFSPTCCRSCSRRARTEAVSFCWLTAWGIGRYRLRSKAGSATATAMR